MKPTALLARPWVGSRPRAGSRGQATDRDPDTEKHGEHGHDRLGVLRDEHRAAPYPPGFRGVDIEGGELILPDADVAGLVRQELGGGLDGGEVAMLRWCIAGLDKALPLVGDEYCASCFARLRTMAGIVADPYLPAAT